MVVVSYWQWLHPDPSAASCCMDVWSCMWYCPPCIRLPTPLSCTPTSVVSVCYLCGISVVHLWHWCGTSGISVVHLWYLSGASVVSVWYLCDISMVPLWYQCGPSVVFVWYLCGISLVPLWYLSANTVVSEVPGTSVVSGTFVVSVWYICGIRVVPLWYQCGTSVVSVWYLCGIWYLYAVCLVHIRYCCGSWYLSGVWYLCNICLVPLWWYLYFPNATHGTCTSQTPLMVPVPPKCHSWSGRPDSMVMTSSKKRNQIHGQGENITWILSCVGIYVSCCCSTLLLIAVFAVICALRLRTGLGLYWIFMVFKLNIVFVEDFFFVCFLTNLY